MSFLDKIMGRGKKAAGDVTGDDSMRKDGMHQEEEGMASERAESAEQQAQAEGEGRASRGALGHLNRRCNGAFEGGESRPLSCHPTAALRFVGSW